MEKDILNIDSAKLKKMPFNVPEGYFETLGSRVSERAYGQTEHRKTIWQMVTPALSMAAAFAIIVASGTFILNRTAADENMTFEDYIIYSDILDISEYDESSAAEYSVEDEDIIDYLIYTGVTAEAIELSK